jgi:hypothetical protein
MAVVEVHIDVDEDPVVEEECHDAVSDGRWKAHCCHCFLKVPGVDSVVRHDQM